MPAVIGQGPGRRLVIEVLYVEHCPCVPAALSLVHPGPRQSRGLSGSYPAAALAPVPGGR